MNTSTCHESTLSIVCSVFDAYSAVLFLPGHEPDTFRLASAFSLGDMVAPQTSIAAGKGLVGWILRNRQPLLVNNFDQRQSYLGYYQSNEEATIKAFMGCPVRGGGALCIDSKRQYSFSDKDQKILQLFADLVARIEAEGGQEQAQASTAGYYASLEHIQDLRRRYTKWPLFLQHFMATMVETTGFDYCVFASRDSNGQNFAIEGESRPLMLGGANPTEFPMGTGIVGWVFRNDAPVINEGTDGTPPAALFGKNVHLPAFQSVVCLPLIISKVTRGVLCLAHEEPRRVPDDMRSFARMAVDHLALFLENLYLKNRLRDFMPQAQLQRRTPLPYHRTDDTSDEREND